MAGAERVASISEDDWKDLLSNIADGLCTPFIGVGACDGVLPLATAISEDWATQYDFPFAQDRSDLARVAQFLAIKRNLSETGDEETVQ